MRLRDLSLSEYLDCVWALKVRINGGMMNPFEYRDLMNVAFGYSTETVDQVKKRYESKGDTKHRPGKAPGPPTAKASATEPKKQAVMDRPGSDPDADTSDLASVCSAG